MDVNRRSCRAPPAGSLDRSRGGDFSELGRDMSIVPDFGSRLSALVERRVRLNGRRAVPRGGGASHNAGGRSTGK
jgi:hypothetical protein